MKAESGMFRDAENTIDTVSGLVCEKKRHLLFFVQKRLQLFRLVVLLQPILVSLQHCQGREKTDTSLQSMPFSLTGEGHFFLFLVLGSFLKIHSINQ